MKAHSLSTAFTTNKVEESRDFYIKYFDAKVTFDCGWYAIQATNGITLYIY